MDKFARWSTRVWRCRPPGIWVAASALLTVAVLAGCSTAANSVRKAAVRPAAQGSTGPGVPPFTVRPGYRVTLAVDNIDDPRFMAFDDKGTLYVSRPGHEDILALTDPNAAGVYQKRTEFVTGRHQVHGLCWHNGWLWFSVSRGIYKARDTKGTGVANEVVAVIPDGTLPGGSGHWWRSILVTNDAIYTSLGDEGNVTDQTGTEREKMWKFNLDGAGKELFCSGIRNTEKLLLRPGTNEIWGCDNGSDWFGAALGEPKNGKQPITDRYPPDEFNHYVKGGFYGHPFIVGDGIPRVELQNKPDIVEWAAKSIPPEWDFHPHWATLGFTFITKNYFPPEQKGDAYVACHGSWNSSNLVGYRIQRVLFDKWTGKPYGSLLIVKTLSPSGDVLARPVDCVEAPGGTLLFSSDTTNRIFRISLVGNG